MINEVHIPTVKGASNVINIQTPTVAVGQNEITIEVTQSLLLDPVINQTLSDNPTLGGGLFIRQGVGIYDYKKVGAFPNGTQKVAITLRSGAEKTAKATIFTTLGVSTQALRFTTYNTETDVATDDILEKAIITITDYSIGSEVPTNNEETFNYIVSLLDANQVKLWSKIVVRFGGTVTEVDGNTYRRLANFGQSSKIIES